MLMKLLNRFKLVKASEWFHPALELTIKRLQKDAMKLAFKHHQKQKAQRCVGKTILTQELGKPVNYVPFMGIT